MRLHVKRKATRDSAFATKLLSCAALSVLLGACATTEETQAPAATPAPAQQPAPPRFGSQLPELPASDAGNQALLDEINRDGRVVQLGNFTEQAPQVTPPANDVVELNYEQEDLRLVLEQLGNALNLNMVIDPTIDARVSLRTSPGNPLRYADIWPLMRTLARNAGVTIEQSGNLYQFTRNPSGIPNEIVFPGGTAGAAALQVTPLRFISVEAAEAIINPLLQPSGSIIRLGPANLIGINGSPEQLDRINALLEVIDDDPFLNQGIRLFQLQNSQASAVAEELTNIMRLIEGEQPSYQVLGLERINAVLVIAPAGRGFDEAQRWVNILDAQSQDQAEQLFVYRVKSLNALNLADTLNEVFGQLSDEEAAARDQRQRQGEATSSQPGPLVPDAVNTNPFVNGPLIQAAPVDVAPPDAAAAQASGAANAVSADLTVTIVADEDTNTLLIRATPREYRQLLTTISSLDLVPPQVLINAVIGQATLNDITEFGIDWVRVSGNAASGPAQLSSSFLPSDLFDEAGNLVRGPGSGLLFTRTFMDGSAVIDATLAAIAVDNEVTLLARPTILTANNKEGKFLVGQEVPVNNGTINLGQGQTSTNIAYQPVGIELTITPHINDEGFINLEIFQSLSSIEAVTGVGDNPIFSNQEVTTTVVVSDQTTITLGGLIQDDGADNNSGIPVLNRIPLLGALFSYQQYSTQRRELFIILRPQIIRGDGSDNAVLQQFRESFTNVATLLREAGL